MYFVMYLLENFLMGNADLHPPGLQHAVGYVAADLDLLCQEDLGQGAQGAVGAAPVNLAGGVSSQHSFMFTAASKVSATTKVLLHQQAF
jgi:hypothetical protein